MRRRREFSPLSDILPVEFYAACVIVLFVALAALPIARITQDDRKAGLLQRQLIGGISPYKSFLSKWIAGTLMLLMQYAVLCFALLIITGSLAYFAGSFAMLLGVLRIVLCPCQSNHANCCAELKICSFRFADGCASRWLLSAGLSYRLHTCRRL